MEPTHCPQRSRKAQRRAAQHMFDPWAQPGFTLCMVLSYPG